MPHLPSSSSAAGSSLAVREPWQLTARQGADALLVALTMPVLLSTVSMVSITVLGGDGGAVVMVLRLLGMLAAVVTLFAIARLAAAPGVTSSQRWTVSGIVLSAAIAAALPTFNDDAVLQVNVAALVMAQVGELAHRLAVLWLCRHIDTALPEPADLPPWPWWNASAVLLLGGVAMRAAIAPTLLSGVVMPVMLVASSLTFASFALAIAGVVRLRRRLV